MASCYRNIMCSCACCGKNSGVRWIPKVVSSVVESCIFFSPAQNSSKTNPPESSSSKRWYISSILFVQSSVSSKVTNVFVNVWQLSYLTGSFHPSSVFTPSSYCFGSLIAIVYDIGKILVSCLCHAVGHFSEEERNTKKDVAYCVSICTLVLEKREKSICL